MSSSRVNQVPLAYNNQQQQLAPEQRLAPEQQNIAQQPDLDEVVSPNPPSRNNRTDNRQRRGNPNGSGSDTRIRQRASPNDDIEDDEGNDEGPRQKKAAYYKSPDICCCDLQSGLVTMAVIDIIVGFIFFVVALSKYIGPVRGSSNSSGEGGDVPVHYHRRYFYHHHHRVWRFRRAAADDNMTTTTTTTTTTLATTTTTLATTTTTLATTMASSDNSGKDFFVLAFMSALFITIASVALLSSALMRKRTLCWVSCMIGSLIFLADSVLYCIYVFGNDDAGGAWPGLAGLILALTYRIYESVVVFYFIKEPDPPVVRYAPGRDVIYDDSPAVIYEPVYGGGYGGYGYGRPYYGGYGGYGYGAGLGVTTGLGLGLALGGGFHDHYDYCDGGFGYDCY